MPAVHMLSLMSTGTPVRGVAFPAANRWSAFRACSRAPSPVTVTKACTFGSTWPMRSR